MVNRCASTREVDSLTSRISVLESEVSSGLKELENTSLPGSRGESTIEESELTIPRAERSEEGKN